LAAKIFAISGLTYEVDTDGGDVGLCVGIVGESQQQARLPDTRVSDEQELEEVVVSVAPSVSSSAFTVDISWSRADRRSEVAVLWTRTRSARRPTHGVDKQGAYHSGFILGDLSEIRA
jgi:hypothetical protein